MTRALEAALLGVALGTPGGRLTLATGTPVVTSDQASKTTVYYTPYLHDRIPLYNGTEWAMREFTELSIAMAGSANWAADTNYDLYVYDDAGTTRLVTGAAWTNATTRSESLTSVNGILTNNASMTGRYGAASTVSIGANLATYVGTMRTTGSTGTTSFVFDPGEGASGTQTVTAYLWNYYNRVPYALKLRVSTATWSYTTAAYRQMRADTGNSIKYVAGISPLLDVAGVGSAACAGAGIYITGIQLDATSSVESGTQFYYNNYPAQSTAVFVQAFLSRLKPSAGYHAVNATEYGNVSGCTIYGSGNYLLSIRIDM